MCGIGGILRTDGKPIPEEWLDAIDARIAWRGPDGHGRFRDRVEFVDERGEKRIVEVAFVHRRLSIIDHEGGHQPMVSERGRNEREGLVAVVFNGCIYNHRELRKELEAKGHRFVSDHSDTEVLIHGWREWDRDLPQHLEGMFAFALWDRASATIIFARDWFGEKPLFLRTVFHDEASRSPRMVFFSSTPQLVSELPLWYPIFDDDYGQLWITAYLQTGESRFLCLNDGCTWNVHPSGIEGWGLDGPAFLDDQFSLGHDSPARSLSPEEVIESRLAQAVESRLEADVPLGCFLSGGVDSSLIAAFAKSIMPNLRTFGVSMPDPRYDETQHAISVAEHLGTDHSILQVSADPANDLIHLITLLGQPFSDSSILPTFWVSKAARQHVKVALSGDGGDELFMGYERYQAADVLAQHWRWLSLLPLGFLHRSHPRSGFNKLARLRDMAIDYSRIGLVALGSTFTISQVESLMGCEYRPFLNLPGRRGAAAARLRQWDARNYLSFDLLRKVDTASLACGLEVRCPFLDRDLARAALSMPIDQLMPGGQRKGLLRQIARKYLPREIVDRPKMGFAIPIGEWFRSDYGGMKTLLLDHLNSTEPFGPISLNRQAVQRFIDEHMSGKRDHGQRLFTLLTLSIWAKSRKVEKSKSRQ